MYTFQALLVVIVCFFWRPHPAFASLSFVPLGPKVPCGDGSPAGIYGSGGSERMTSKKHVLLFDGGGYCDTEEMCKEQLSQKVFRLSSLAFPKSIQGRTILSDDPSENPSMFDFYKWMVPYCSQDMYVGSGNGRIAGLVRAGSLHVLAVLDHIRNSTREIDELVVVGSSAGSMAVLNHIDQIRKLARDRGVESLKVVLDSSMFFDQSDYINLEAISPGYVDYSTIPLCNLEEYPIIQEISTIPCCLSVHCHIRNGLFEMAGNNESLLFIDSVYDPLAALHMVKDAYNQVGDKGTVTPSMEAPIFSMGEFAGDRLQSATNSLFSTNTHNSTVIWALPSCIAHPFLVYTSFASQLCGLFVMDGSSYIDCSNVESDEITTGLVIKDGPKVGTISSPRKWKDALVGKHTIENLIGGFINPNIVAFDPPLILSTGITLLTDDCSGPNCVPGNSITKTNSCQDYVAIENDYKGVPFGVQIFLVLIIGLLILGYSLRFKILAVNVKPAVDLNHGTKVKVDFQRAEGKQAYGVKLDQVSVFTKSGDPILIEVDVKLEPGTVTGLMGRSGSGKSTLLGAISGQMRPNVVLAAESDIKVNIASTAYMRQNDNVTLENMTPSSFLDSCADVYRSSPDVLREIREFTKPFFPKRVVEEADDEDENEVLLAEPFETTQIKSCSGGQRRVLAVGAAMLTSPTILLLDEPLSGLDSVSSDRLMSLLKTIAFRQRITILVIVHQPSDDIIGQLDGLVIMHHGRKIFDEVVANVSEALRMEGTGLRISDFLHEVVKKGVVKESVKENIDHCRRNCARRTSRSGANRRRGIMLPVTPNGGQMKSMHPLSQVLPLSRRLQLEYGTNWADLCILPTCYVIFSLMTSLRPMSPVQIILVCSVFSVFPFLVFQNDIHRAREMWIAHKTELDDRRISCASYFVSMYIFTMCIPMLSLLVAMTIAFGILGWDFSAFLNLYLFSCIYILAMMGMGRCLMLLFRGHFIYIQWMFLVVFFNALFSGSLAPPASVPWGFHFLFFLSFTFWAVSGTVLSLFEDFPRLIEGPCQGFLECVMTNGSFIADPSGYSYISSPFRAMFILIGYLIVFVITEYLLLRNRRTHFVNPSTVVPLPLALSKLDDTSRTSFLHQSLKNSQKIMMTMHEEDEEEMYEEEEWEMDSSSSPATDCAKEEAVDVASMATAWLDAPLEGDTCEEEWV